MIQLLTQAALAAEQRKEKYDRFVYGVRAAAHAAQTAGFEVYVWPPAGPGLWLYVDPVTRKFAEVSVSQAYGPPHVVVTRVLRPDIPVMPLCKLQSPTDLTADVLRSVLEQPLDPRLAQHEYSTFDEYLVDPAIVFASEWAKLENTCR